MHYSIHVVIQISCRVGIIIIIALLPPFLEMRILEITVVRKCEPSNAKADGLKHSAIHTVSSCHSERTQENLSLGNKTCKYIYMKTSGMCKVFSYQRDKK